MTGINAVSYRSRFLKYMHDGLHQASDSLELAITSRFVMRRFRNGCL
jgi:hypothetical protein